MTKRYFFKAQREGRHYNRHYRNKTQKNVFGAKIENFITSLLRKILKRGA
jgi:hypothetical protein